MQTTPDPYQGFIFIIRSLLAHDGYDVGTEGETLVRSAIDAVIAEAVGQAKQGVAEELNRAMIGGLARRYDVPAARSSYLLLMILLSTGMVLFLSLVFWSRVVAPPHADAAPLDGNPDRPAETPATVAEVLPAVAEVLPTVAPDSGYVYQHPPTISLETYQAILSEAGSSMASEAASMYAALVEAGIDPAMQLGHARKETNFGVAGVGRNHNAHGVKCNGWDTQFGAWCTPDTYSGYPSYTASVQAWAALMTTYGPYLASGRMTLDEVLPVYCPFSDGCNPDAHSAQVKGWVDGWRTHEQQKG